MSVFHYHAYDGTGQTVQGSLEAKSLQALEEKLRALNLWLKEASEGQAASSTTDGVSKIKIRRADLIHFFVQMSLLLKSGINLPTALERLALDNPDSKLGTVVSGLYEQVNVGVPLNQGMARYPRVFSRQSTAMIEAGEVSGRLPEVFESLSSYYEWMDQLTGDIRQALIYPLMVMFAAIGLVTLLFTLVVPRFVGLLTDLNLEVPLITRIVMVISQGLTKGWPILLALVIGIPVAFRIALRNASFARKFDRWLMSLPVFGILVAMFAFSRFSHNLAMLCRSGIPLLRSLEICQQLVGNRAVEHAINDARRLITEGTPLHRALGEQKIFPPTVLTMISTGESSGNVEFALQSVSEYYNKLIPRRIKIVFAVFDPAMMISLIAVVGTVALAVVLPILQLWQAK